MNGKEVRWKRTPEQQKIFRTAMYYLTEQQLEDVPCRFDVVGIEGTKITLIKNAFGG